MHRVISKRCGWVVNFFVDALNTCHYEFRARFPLSLADVSYESKAY